MYNVQKKTVMLIQLMKYRKQMIRQAVKAEKMFSDVYFLLFFLAFFI